MDYRKKKMFSAEGWRVEQLCVVGAAAELFWERAFGERKGMNSLVWSDVQSVELRQLTLGKEVLKKVRVGLSREDSVLALRAARAVVNLVEQSRYRVVDAIVEQRDAKGKRVGEHDLLGEERQPTASSARGLASWEVKFRRIETAKLLADVRRELQEEAWAL